MVAGTDRTVRIMQLRKAVLQIFYIGGYFFFPVPVPQMTTLEIRQKSNHNLLALRKQMTLFGCQILLLVLVLFSDCIVTRADTQVKPDDLNAFIS